jgi:hypothetical protein
MRFRKLRIAWSVVWAWAAVLLIGLSVRSQSRFDGIRWHHNAVRNNNNNSATKLNELNVISSGSPSHNAEVFQIYIYQGQLSIVSFDDEPLPPDLLHQVARIGTVECFESPELIGEGANPVFGIFTLPIGRRIEIPAWFLIVSMVLLGLLPWMPWLRFRFSLLTLLIATTLAAVVLGLIVWLR